jgi:RNA polymerase sigma factor (sigma-70 family)
MLDAYLADVGQRPLLSPAQEHAIALEVRDSRRALEHIAPEQVAAARARAARALDRLVGANLRLVIAIARRYRRRGLELCDLVQEGNLGLLRAAERFDPDRGLRFSTYAAWIIQGAIHRAVADKARTVRVPVHLLDAQLRLAAVANAPGRQATDDELSAALGMSALRVRRIRESARAVERCVSLDTSEGIDLTDHGTPAPDELLSERRRAEQARRLLGTLPSRERRILRARFEDDASYKQAGEREGLSRERARQLERLALAKLHDVADP